MLIILDYRLSERRVLWLSKNSVHFQLCHSNARDFPSLDIFWAMLCLPQQPSINNATLILFSCRYKMDFSFLSEAVFTVKGET